jgi:hypothetical protein
VSRPLPLVLTTLYAELHDLTAHDAGSERREGGFAAKQIKGRRYWYYQRWVGGRRVQKLVGPDDPATLQHIARWKEESAAWRRERDRRRQLVRSLKAGLRMTTDRLTSRVIKTLSESGIFAAGGVLIGTQAYMTYGPMLGVRLAQSNLHTADIDIGAVDLALEDTPVSLADAIRSADENFFVVPARPRSRISTALKYKGGELRVELLTPHRTGEPWSPVIVRSLGFGAQQAPYLGYLLEHAVEATYVAEDAIRVRVPDPARFALHKLIVAADRAPSSHAKSLKDRAQAAELMVTLAESRPADLEEAARALVAQGQTYVGKALAGARPLPEEVRAKVTVLLGNGPGRGPR